MMLKILQHYCGGTLPLLTEMQHYKVAALKTKSAISRG
jgi:hypothetical protein